jgi:hypothetical protein
VARLRYQGQEVEIVERPTLGERAWSERTHPTSRNAATWTGAESEFAQLLISLKRAGIVIGWDVFEAATFGHVGDGGVTPADFVVVPDPEPDPTLPLDPDPAAA